MKKTLLLSVAASAMIMAGGDIAPATAAPATVSGWDFSGTAKVYYETTSAVDLFDQMSSDGNVGIQLRATNSDVFAGIGAGFELSGVGTLDLEKSVVGAPMQRGHWSMSDLTGAWISQAYLTYAVNNTSFKAGRQELPMGLSPFAYSENWNVWSNTFDGVLVVNSDLPDTTAVLAWVKRGNHNHVTSNMGSFNAYNGSDGVWMLTLQNKSIENVTLTGSYYNIDGNAIYWADAQIALGDYTVGLQGGQVDQDITGNPDDTTAFGAKVSTAINGFNLALAYSNTDNGGLFQVGGMTSALYTNTVANQLAGNNLEEDASKVVLTASTELFGGTVIAAYAAVDSDNTGNTDELDLVYTTNITDSFNLTAAYVNVSPDVMSDLDVIRVVGTYNF